MKDWLQQNATGLAATLSFLAIAAGFWLAWAPLGLIVPGSIVFGSLVWRHLKRGEDE